MSLGAQEEVPYLTPKRRAILDAIVASHDERGYPPSIGELCEAVDLTRATVHWHLGQLHRDGWVRSTPGQPRTLVVLRQPSGESARDQAVAALMHMWGIEDTDEEGYDGACLAVDLVAPILRRER